MQPLNILIVEDEIITATDLDETLTRAGHRVVATAQTYDEALEAVHRYAPDLAIVDIQLKRSSADGIRTAAALLAHRWMPIIYLTANSELPTVERARETAPAAYLLKPFRHNELAIQVELAYHNFRINGPSDNDPAQVDNVFLPYNKGYEKINKSSVLYLQAAGAYVNIRLVDDEKTLLFTLNLGYLAQFFTSANFYRLSRSLVINLDHVSRLESNQLFMHRNLVSLPIPEGSRADLMKRVSVIRSR